MIPLWLAHEIAHVVRYTSPSSRSMMRDIVLDAGGYYSYWETGRQAPLRELLMNEGLAVQVSRAVSPGHATWGISGSRDASMPARGKSSLCSIAPPPVTSTVPRSAYACGICRVA